MPEADRIPVWREDFGRLVRLDVEALSDLPFRSDLKMRVLPGLGIISGTHSLFRASRTRKLLADGNDDLVLHFRTGGGVGMQLNREVTVGPRDTVLLSNCDIGPSRFRGQARLSSSACLGWCSSRSCVILMPLSCVRHRETTMRRSCSRAT